ncbi:MAG: hypothetical protein H7301_10670 [Cryobacterium sp.]|nr:hypothetical protein [Oligoflexia bacterium]
MATLSFTSDQSRTTGTSNDDPRGKHRLDLALSEGTRREIAAALTLLTPVEGNELRTHFPGGWTVFWKMIAGESRLLVAHPELNEWVATLALSSDHIEKLRRRLLDLGKESLSLSVLEKVSRVSNLEVSLAPLPEPS